MATVTNRRTIQALRGESTWILLDASDSAKLAAMTIGQQATLSSSSKTGYVSRIDLYGHSFQITPNRTITYLESSSKKGYLLSGETITLS